MPIASSNGPQNPRNVQLIGAWGSGDERGSTEQSALPPAFYRCPAAGAAGTFGRGDHVEQDRGDGATTWYSKRHTTFAVTVKPIRCARQMNVSAILLAETRAAWRFRPITPA